MPGLFNAYRAGNVVIANAPGTGVADDKAVYAYVPRLIRYYLAEEPILENVETFLCRESKELSHMLANLDKLVVKAVGESGGYGMLVGPHAVEDRARRLRARRSRPIRRIISPSRPSSFPPRPASSTASIEPRHVDLRPFILHGERTTDRARRAHPRGAQARQPGGEFQPGRRLEGHLGIEQLTC